MKTNKFYQTLIGLALISIVASCELEEEIFTEILSSEFGETSEEVNSLVGAAYSSYGGWIGGPWVTQVISSDIGIVNSGSGIVISFCGVVRISFSAKKYCTDPKYGSLSSLWTNTHAS